MSGEHNDISPPSADDSDAVMGSSRTLAESDIERKRYDSYSA